MRALIFSLLMLATAAAAASDGDALDVKARPFAPQAKAIRAELAKGDRYSEISVEDHARLTSLLDSMGSLIEEAGGFEQLPADIESKVISDQASVNSILTRAAEDSRVVCRREKATGTNRATKVCATAAQRRRLRENTQRWGRDSGMHR